MTSLEATTIFKKYVVLINKSFGTNFHLFHRPGSGECFLASRDDDSFRMSLGFTTFEAGQRLISLFHTLEQFDKIHAMLKGDRDSIFFVDVTIGTG